MLIAGQKRPLQSLENIDPSPRPAKEPRSARGFLGIFPTLLRGMVAAPTGNAWGARAPGQTSSKPAPWNTAKPAVAANGSADDEHFPALSRNLQGLKIGNERKQPAWTPLPATPPVASTSLAPRKKEPMFKDDHNARVRERDQMHRESLVAKYEAAQRKGYKSSMQDHAEYLQYKEQIRRQQQQVSWREEWAARMPDEKHDTSLADIGKRQDPHMVEAIRRAKQAREAPMPRKPTLPVFQSLTNKERDLDADLDRRKQKRRRFPPALTPERELRVKELLKAPEGTIVSTMPGAEVTGRDMRKLVPREWLNDEIINFYAVMLNVRSKAYQAELEAMPAHERPPLLKRKYLKVHAFTSFFVSKLTNTGYDGVKRWTKKVDLFACDSVVMPVNQGNTHWTAACINVRLKRFEFYDSMGSTNNKLLQMLRKYLQAEHLDKKKKPLDLSDWEDWQLGEDAPQQENAFDCGVFTSQVLECLSRPNAALDYAQENMPYLRKKMIYEIGEKSFLEDEEWE